MIREKIYLETSVISFLTARPSRDLLGLAKQELTRQWWGENSTAYDFYISDPVLEEIRKGDKVAALHRMELVADLPVLDINDEVVALSHLLLSAKILPAKAALDILHVAIAAAHGMSYLATWNCRHLNNAALKRQIQREIAAAGYNEVIIATPEELWRK